MARRHASRFTRPAAKTKVWFGLGTGTITIVAATTQILTSLNAAALALRPFTILRTHAQIMLTSDQTATSETPEGALGRTIVTEQALAIGATAVPDPLLEPDADWYLYQAVMTTFLFGDATGFGPDGNQYSIDSKAMRKVGINDDVITVIQASPGALLTIRGRMLVQLS